MADINITTSIQGLDTVSSQLQGFGQSVTDVGKTLTAGLTVPLAAAGAGLLAVANDFEQARNTLRNATGAVGSDLRALEEVSRNVFRQVPGDIQQISEVVGELNTRTGQTGPVLQAMSRQVVEAARLLGEDANQLATGFSQTLVQFGINAQDAGATLDAFFRISQNQGIGLNQVIGQVNTYGAVLQSAGLNAGESADLIARMNTAGIDFSRVSPGINAALRNFAKEGRDLTSSLSDAVEEIRNAENRTDKLRIATEIFGSEGAQRIVQAIDSGVLPSLQGLGRGLENASGAIIETGEQSRSFSEDITLMKNNLLDALEPLGGQLVELVRQAMPAISDLIVNVRLGITAFQELSPQVQATAGIVAAALGLGGPILIAVGALISGISSVVGAFTTLGPLVAAAGPVGILVAGIAVAAGLIIANFDEVKAAVHSLGVGFSQVGGSIGENLALAEASVRDFTSASSNSFTEFYDLLVINTTAAMMDAAGLVEDFGASVTGTFDYVSGSVSMFVDGVTDTVSGMVDSVTGYFDGMRTTVVSVIDDTVGRVNAVFESLSIGNAASAAADSVIGIFETMQDVLVGNSIIPDTVDAIGDEMNRLPAEMSEPARQASEQVQSQMTTLKNESIGLTNETVVGITNSVSGLPSALGGTAASAVSSWLSEFTNLRQGTIDILGDVIGSINDFIQTGSINLASFAGWAGQLFGNGGASSSLISGGINAVGNFFGSNSATQGDLLGSIGSAFGLTGTGGLFETIGLTGPGGLFDSAAGTITGTGSPGLAQYSNENGMFGNLFSGGVGDFLSQAGTGLAASGIGSFLGSAITGNQGSDIGQGIGAIVGFFNPLLGGVISFLDSAFGNAPDIPGFTIDTNTPGITPREIIANNELLKAYSSPFGLVDYRTRNKPLQGANWKQDAAAIADSLDALAIAEMQIAGVLPQNSINSIKSQLGMQGRELQEGNMDFMPWFTERFGIILGGVSEAMQGDILGALDTSLGENEYAPLVAQIVANALQGGSNGMGGIQMFQTGGEAIFSRPSLIGVGEVGPERVSVTPLASGGRNNGPTVVLNGPAIFDGITMNKFIDSMSAQLERRAMRYG